MSLLQMIHRDILVGNSTVMERVTGVWLDLNHALIYHLQKGKNDFVEIASEVEHYHLVGGSGSSTPYGPQEAVSERRFLERKKHQKRDYFKRIASHLSRSAEVILMGPAETKFQLNDLLNRTPERIYTLHRPMTRDSMTENQVKASIRDFYRAQTR